jgi:RecD/TraA family predicted helicase
LGRAAEEFAPDPELTDEQRAAVTAALTHGVSVLTGGPGTGKTRTVLEIVRACEARDLRVALCAPTGRAAKRLEEVTGRAASTVHRLLEARGVPGAGFRFGMDEHRPLPQDVVVADEWSMADARLAHALARAVGDGAHLVLVGDADQLPSVGPGAVLRDLLDPASAALVASTRLSRIHRQAAASRIVTLAHEVNAGTVRSPWARRGAGAAREGDVFAVPERPPAVARRVAAIVAERAPAYFGCVPSDVQVLAPMYKGPAGVDALNAALKERLNPPAGRPLVGGWHEGDRVVSTRNDPELDVANGDIGEVVATDRGARTVEVAFATGSAVYDADRARDLAPAWCLTVHKAQGGEWPVVVFVLDHGHRTLLWRELVYTGITRAASGLLLVGSPELLAAAAGRTGAGARGRLTGLAPRLAREALLADDPAADDTRRDTSRGR